MGIESVQVPFSICACNNDGELEGACHAGKAGPGVSTFPWWIVVLIVVIVTIVIVLALFVRRKPEGKLEGKIQISNHTKIIFISKTCHLFFWNSRTE